MRTAFRLSALALTGAFALAACGGGGDTSTVAPSAQASTTVASTTATTAAAASTATTAAAAPETTTTAAPTVVKVSANTATQAQIAQAFEAAGVASAANWAKEVVEYRPYPTTDPTFAKLRQNLVKYNPGPGVVDSLVAVLSL